MLMVMDLSRMQAMVACMPDNYILVSSLQGGREKRESWVYENEL